MRHTGSAHHVPRVVVALTLAPVCAVAACTEESGTNAEDHRASSSRSSEPSPPADCAVTRPEAADGSFPRERLFGWKSAYGNDGLWVGGLGPNGVIVAPGPASPEGISWKLGWWRETSGRLRIVGHRVDGDARPLRSRVPSGYGTSGFQSTEVTFPTTGCWRVTGKLDQVSLTFTTYVIEPTTQQSSTP